MSQTTDQGRSKATSVPGRKSRTGRTPRGGAPARPAMPTPPRRRRPALTALAVLLIIGGAALAGLLAVRMDSRESVLVIAQQVDSGELITEGMLESRNVSGEGIAVVPTDQKGKVVDKLYARATLYPGTLLQGKLLRSDPPLEVDQAQVGVPLSPGKYPPDLRSGDAVRLVQIGDSQNPSEALATGYVLEVTKTKSSGFASAGSSSVATIVVPQSVVDRIVGATGTDSLGIAQTARGVSVDDAEIADLTGGRD